MWHELSNTLRRNVHDNNCFSSVFFCLYPLHKQYQLLHNYSTDLLTKIFKSRLRSSNAPHLLKISINVNIVVYTNYCCLYILFIHSLGLLFVDFYVLVCHFFFNAGVCCSIKQYENL